jgi:hypothetical protein
MAKAIVLALEVLDLAALDIVCGGILLNIMDQVLLRQKQEFFSGGNFEEVIHVQQVYKNVCERS